MFFDNFEENDHFKLAPGDRVIQCPLVSNDFTLNQCYSDLSFSIRDAN